MNLSDLYHYPILNQGVVWVGLHIIREKGLYNKGIDHNPRGKSGFNLQKVSEQKGHTQKIRKYPFKIYNYSCP